MCSDEFSFDDIQAEVEKVVSGRDISGPDRELIIDVLNETKSNLLFNKNQKFFENFVLFMRGENFDNWLN